MKKLLLLLFVALSSLLTGCFESTEEIAINDNGSGIYQTTVDMSGLFDFIDMMKAMDTSSAASGNRKLITNMDTVIQMRTMMDTSSGLTKDQLELVKDATMQLQMNEANRVFKIRMQYPYARISDLDKILQLNQDGNVLSKALKGSAGMPGSEAEEVPAMPDFGAIFTSRFTNNLIEKKVSPEKLKAFKADEKYGEMKQAMSLFSSSAMNTVIKLPRPAKKVEGAGAKLSADKRTVTVNATIGDIFDDPNALSYRIEY